MHGIVSETFDIHILDIFVDTWYSCVLVAYLDSLYLPYLTFEVDTTRGSIQRSGHNLDSLCLSVILQLQEVYIQLTSLRWLVFCRCFEKNCTLHCNVIYFQTIGYISCPPISRPSFSVNPSRGPDGGAWLHCAPRAAAAATAANVRNLMRRGLSLTCLTGRTAP